MPLPEPVSVDLIIDADVPLPSTVTEEAAADLVAYVFAAEGASGTWQIGIRFVDDATMQVAHRDFMGIDTPTDIMTFPYASGSTAQPADDAGPWPGSMEQGGDLLISVDRAADHAADAGWGVDNELLFLIVHGVLHLLGWDDATGQARGAMLARQRDMLQGWQARRLP